jgi:F-type H+-transporting ATPase subunit alpha
MDDIEVKQVLPFEAGLHQFLKTSHGALLDRLNEKRAFDKEGKDEAELNAAVAAFKKSFA